MAHKVGPKEQQRIDLRLRRFEERGPGAARRTKALSKMTPEAVDALRNLEKRIMTEAPASKPTSAPVTASAPAQQETSMATKHAKKASKARAKKRTAKSSGRRTIRAQARRAGTVAQPAKRGGTKVVPALDVANFMARPAGKDNPLGGASMKELEAEFGIEAHPMRAKIHYVRNQMAGWDVENKDGRYFATFTESK